LAFPGLTRPSETAHEMSIEIDILNGDAAWTDVEPLYQAIWPPEVVAKLPWADVVSAHADLRVLLRDDADEVVCHVGIYRAASASNVFAIRRPNGAGSLRRSDFIRNSVSAPGPAQGPELRQCKNPEYGFTRARTSRSTTAAGNGIFGCRDEAPEIVIQPRECLQRPKSGK
jgi:hypothetical protein